MRKISKTPSRLLRQAVFAAMFFAAGLTISASFDLTAPVSADRLWHERNTNPAALTQKDPVNLGSFARLAKTLSPAVVNINVVKSSVDPQSRSHQYLRKHYGSVPRKYTNRGLGSGFIIHADGWILTNNHVVEGASKITVQLHNEHTYAARIVGADPKTDVALLKIEPKENLTSAPLGDSQKLQIGEWAVAIGNPFGLNHTVTAGIISAKGRQEVSPDGRQGYSNFIQTDASINPGNSGGPLINIRGEVVGINTAINSNGQGIGFAIPINMVKVLLPQLRSGEVKRSWLGVMIQEVSPELAESLRLGEPQGALVAEVAKGGPAALAGVRAGDVILAFNNRPVRKSGDLPWLASTAGIGADVSITVWRRWRAKDLTVTMGTLKTATTAARVEKANPDSGPDASPKGVGLRIEPNTRALAKKLKLPRVDGLVITRVDAGSPADQAGLEPGDILLQVSNAAVGSVKAFAKEMGNIESGRVVMLLVQRGDRKLFRAFTRQ
ncbi:MAG: serine protease Do [Myxococcota bacterium]|jgi:serine protease Do